MTYTYDPLTPVGFIRLRIQDTFEADPIFQDEEIAALLAFEANDLRRGAALCLETIASREALVQKAIKLLALSTDGPKLAAELRAQAATLRQQAHDAANGALTGEGLFDIATPINTPFAAREYMRKRRIL